jgi:hypothetical protein
VDVGVAVGVDVGVAVGVDVGVGAAVWQLSQSPPICLAARKLLSAVTLVYRWLLQKSLESSTKLPRFISSTGTGPTSALSSR